MGWSESEHWPRRDPDAAADFERITGLRASETRWPSSRRQESEVRFRALRAGVGWRGPIDQDGYPASEKFPQPALLDVLAEHSAVEDSGDLSGWRDQ